MTVKDLEELFDYGHWADRKLFDVISQLTPAQFTQPVAGSHGSIRNTMVHVLSAEWGWLDRCGGGVHHRGQVALLLRSLGYVPGNFDILFYYADKRGVAV